MNVNDVLFSVITIYTCMHSMYAITSMCVLCALCVYVCVDILCATSHIF